MSVLISSGVPGYAELLGEIPRPLRRAHAHHRPLRRCVIQPALLDDVPAPYLVPDLLGLEDDAVQVEDDCADHSVR
jgi:hypothetical protein